MKAKHFGWRIGMSGPLALNEACDRAHAQFDVFRVQSTSDGPAWARIAETP